MLWTRRLLLIEAALGFALLTALTTMPISGKVRINGSSTVNPVVVEAANLLRIEQGLEILVDTVGGSSGGIAALGDGRVEIGMSSRPVSDQDRWHYPRADFRAVHIGTDALALVVSRDVWESGVRALTKEQIRALYEGRIRNWREIGGPDRRVVFFNKEPGRGTWEVFAHWLYGGADDAPLVNLPTVGSNEEGRNKVASTPGAITQLSANWADGQRVFALALRTDEGKEVSPSDDRLLDGTYPLARPLFVITNGPAGAETQLIIDFLVGPRGQELVARYGYLPIAGAKNGEPES